MMFDTLFSLQSEVQCQRKCEESSDKVLWRVTLMTMMFDFDTWLVE